MNARSSAGAPAITRRSVGFFISSAAAGVVAPGSAAGAGERAPDVVLLCEPTLHSVMSSAADLWRRATAVPVRIFTARSDLLVEEIARGARCDLVVLTGDDVIESATRRNLVVTGSPFAAWRNRLVIARRGPSNHVVALTAGGDLLALLGGGRLAVADETVSAAGVKSRAALESLGQWASLQDRLRGAESTPGVAFLLATLKAEFGMVYTTDVMADPALSIAATLPVDGDQETVCWLARAGNEAVAGAPLLWSFLRGTEARSAIEAGGLEPLG